MEKSKEGEEGLRSHTVAIPSISRKLARTSSVYDLPAELLSCIFEFGHGNSEDENDRGYRSGSRYWDGIDFYPIEDSETAQAQAPANKCSAPSFRMTVLLVCHHWYRVAITTPSLWTTLLLASWESFEVLQTMLARSRGLPLYVDVYHYIETDEPDHIDAYRMNSDDESVRPRPRLEQRYITLFRSLAPRFRRLRLRKSRLSWSEPWISSMSNLTTLELIDADEFVRPSWSELLSMLRSASGLKRLVLRDAGPCGAASPRPENSDIPVQLLNLTDLVLASYETPAGTTALLKQLYIPALKSLSLDLTSPMDNFNIFIEQLAGPATLPATGPTTGEQYTLLNQLEHLYIFSLWRNDIAALGMLYDGLHTLKSLQICLSDSWNTTPRYSELLYLLLPHTPSGQSNLTVRLPRLETLIVCRHFGRIAPIREVVEKRKAAGFPLKSLYIQNPDREDMRWLGENIETFTMF